MGKPKTLAKEVEAAPSFKEAAEVVARKLQLPDLHSIEGLEKANTQFPGIWKKLKDLWIGKNEKVMGAVCVIFGKMSVDSILRSKLAKEGAITLLVDALKIPSLQLVSLRAMAIMTSHGGMDERLSVADKSGQAIVNIAQKVKDDDPIFTYCVSVLCHSSFAAYQVDSGRKPASKPKTPPHVDAKPILELMVRATRHPDPHIAGHALGAITSLSTSTMEYVLQSPAAQKCLVGHLRSPSLVTRIEAVTSIFASHRQLPREAVNMDPQKPLQAAATLRYDEEYQKHFEDTGMSDLMVTLLCSQEYQKAMMKNAQDRDMFALGTKLYDLLMRNEFAIAEGMFQDQHGKPITDMGLPYVTWFEALPHCIKALRSKDPKSEAATILELKYEIRHRRYQHVYDIAKKWISSVNPNSSYCYYAMTMGRDDDKDGLKWAKKGLGTNPTGYVRLGLLYNAIDYATNLGIVALDSVKSTSKKDEASKQLAHGIAYLQSAMKDAEKYVELSPIDGRLLRGVITKYLSLFVAFKGPTEISLNLKEVQPLVVKLASAERFSGLMWSAVKDTPNRATWKLIEKHYGVVGKEWDEFFSHDQGSSKEGHSGDADGQAMDGLVEHLCDEPDETHALDTDQRNWTPHIMSPRYDEGMVELLTCSECRNPSAQVMKCGRCGGARYCDAACQKKAWPAHKKVCKAGPLVKVS